MRNLVTGGAGFTIILLGDIAAGKGTQAKLLAKKFGLKLIGTGAYSRTLWNRIGRIKIGKLTPSGIIQSYLKDELLKLSKNQGVLVDGGKMPAEARLINGIFRKQKRKFLVLYLSIPRLEIYKRLRIRIQKEKRADDRPQAIRNRMNYYKKIYRRTVKYWKSKGLLKIVDGNQKVEKVAGDIEKLIKNYFK